MALGVAIWSINFFIVKTFAAISAYLAELLHASDAVRIGIMLLLCLSFLSLLILITFVGSLVVYRGIAIIMADKW